MNSKGYIWVICILSLVLAGCPSAPQGGEVAVDKFLPVVYDYGGVRVVQARTTREPIEVRLVFAAPGGQGPQASLLREDLALRNAIHGGTSNDAPGDFSKKLISHQAFLSYQTQPGASWIGMSCLSTELESAWPLFQDCALRPAFNQEIFADELKILGRISDLRRKSPLFGLGQLVRSKGFGPFPFELGTVLEEGIPEPDPQSLSSWYREDLLGRNKFALVVVGDVDAEKVADLLLNGLPEAASVSWDQEVVPTNVPPPAGVYLEKSASEKEAIALHLPLLDAKEGTYSQSSLDEAAFRLLGAVLSNRIEVLFANDPQAQRNVRFVHSNAHSKGLWMALDGQGVMPRAELIMSELRKFYLEGLREGELSHARQEVLQEELARLQSNRLQADLWAEQVGHGDYGQWGQLLNQVQVVPEKAVLKLGQLALENLSWFYYGVPSRLDRNSLKRLN